MALSSAALMKAAAPIAKQLAVNAAKMGFAAVKRRRNRRVKQGKWTFGSRLLGLPTGKRKRGRSAAAAAGYDRATLSNMPVRVNVAQSGGNRDLPVADSELSGLVFSTNGDLAEVNPQQVSLDPLVGVLWQKLARKAPEYTGYDSGPIKVIVSPIVGTAFNGTWFMGFTPNPATELDGAYDTPEAIQSLAIHATGSIGQKYVMTIPTSAMSQYGRGLMMANGGAQVGEITRYFLGNLVFGTLGCSTTDGTPSTGVPCCNITMSYSMRLTRPQLDVSPTSCLVDTTSDFVIEHKGREWSASLTGDDSFRVSWLRPAVAIVRKSAPSSAKLELDGVEQSPVAEVNNVGATVYLSYYVLPRKRGFTEITLSNSGTNVEKIMLVSASGFLE
jgi:hypothetical protein